MIAPAFALVSVWVSWVMPAQCRFFAARQGKMGAISAGQNCGDSAIDRHFQAGAWAAFQPSARHTDVAIVVRGAPFGLLGSEPLAGNGGTRRKPICGEDFENGSRPRILVAARHFLSNLSALVPGFQCRWGRGSRQDYRPAALFA